MWQVIVGSVMNALKWQQWKGCLGDRLLIQALMKLVICRFPRGLLSGGVAVTFHLMKGVSSRGSWEMMSQAWSLKRRNMEKVAFLLLFPIICLKCWYLVNKWIRNILAKCDPDDTPTSPHLSHCQSVEASPLLLFRCKSFIAQKIKIKAKHHNMFYLPYSGKMFQHEQCEEALVQMFLDLLMVVSQLPAQSIELDWFLRNINKWHPVWSFISCLNVSLQLMGLNVHWAKFTRC